MQTQLFCILYIVILAQSSKDFEQCQTESSSCKKDLEIPENQRSEDGHDVWTSNDHHVQDVTDRYLEGINKLKIDLDRDGVGVMPGVLNTAECDTIINEINTWLNKFGKENHPDMSDSIIRKYNIGYHPALWGIRLKAAKVFASIYETEKLLSSIDAMAIGEPPELGRNKFVEDGGKIKLHVDQGPRKIGLHAYQGAVYLEEADEEDWCLGILNSSHKYHQEYFEQRQEPLPPGEQVFLTEEEINWYERKGCSKRRVGAPKGGIVLWDSRTIHAGAPPLKNRKHRNRWRYIVFVCMAPAVWASKEEMALRKEVFRDLKLTRHWPSQGFETFRKKPVHSEMNAVNELPEIAKTDAVRLLVGDLQYDFNDGKSNGPDRPLMYGKADFDADFAN